MAPKGTERIVLQHAHRAADAARATAEPLTWSEALDAAPWAREELGAAWEAAYRRAYAQRLVTRGLALPARKSSGSSGRSGGSTDLKGRLVYMSPEELEETAARAKEAGLSWSAWARRRLTEP